MAVGTTAIRACGDDGKKVCAPNERASSSSSRGGWSPGGGGTRSADGSDPRSIRGGSSRSGGGRHEPPTRPSWSWRGLAGCPTRFRPSWRRRPARAAWMTKRPRQQREERKIVAWTTPWVVNLMQLGPATRATQHFPKSNLNSPASRRRGRQDKRANGLCRASTSFYARKTKRGGGGGHRSWLGTHNGRLPSRPRDCSRR